MEMMEVDACQVETWKQSSTTVAYDLDSRTMSSFANALVEEEDAASLSMNVPLSLLRCSVAIALEVRFHILFFSFFCCFFLFGGAAWREGRWGGKRREEKWGKKGKEGRERKTNDETTWCQNLDSAAACAFDAALQVAEDISSSKTLRRLSFFSFLIRKIERKNIIFF